MSLTEKKSAECSVSSEKDVDEHSQAQEPAPLKEETSKDDFLDIKNLRCAPTYANAPSTRKIQLTVPFQKPHSQEFIRVREDDGEEEDKHWHLETYVLKDKLDGKTYVVAEKLVDYLPSQIRRAILYVTINRVGSLGIWPIILPEESGKEPWNEAALQAAELAKKKWIKLEWNKSTRSYDLSEPYSPVPDPEWPQETFQEIINRALKNLVIHDLDHPVIKRIT